VRPQPLSHYDPRTIEANPSTNWAEVFKHKVLTTSLITLSYYRQHCAQRKRRYLSYAEAYFNNNKNNKWSK